MHPLFYDLISTLKYLAYHPWDYFVRGRSMLWPRRFRSLRFRISPTNICNADCIFCNYGTSSMRLMHMPMPIFEKALSLLSPGSVLDLTPALGEPTIDPAFRDKVDLAYSRGHTTDITTNGSGLLKHAEWLVENGHKFRHVWVSTPGFTVDDYRVQFDADFGGTALKGITRVLELNEQAGQPLPFKLSVKNRVAPSRVLAQAPWLKPYLHGRVGIEFTFMWDDYGTDKANWSDYMLKRLRPAKPKLPRPCRLLSLALVNPDGTIRLCGCRIHTTDHDDLLIGTVDNTIGQLTNAAFLIRSRFYHRTYPSTCQHCNLYRPE